MQRFCRSWCQAFKINDMRLVLFSLATVLLAVSCQKNDDKEPSAILVKASVSSTHDLSCVLPVLNFSEDSAKVMAFTGRNDLVYVVKGLPENLNIYGKKLQVSISILKNEEEFPCLMIGISFVHLKVNYATGR